MQEKEDVPKIINVCVVKKNKSKNDERRTNEEPTSNRDYCYISKSLGGV